MVLYVVYAEHSYHPYTNDHYDMDRRIHLDNLHFLPMIQNSLNVYKLVKMLVFHHHHLCIPTLFRSEEHTSELQSRFDLVCRLLLEKKKKAKTPDLTPLS